MKTNAIIRIIIFSVIILLLLGILAAGLGIGMFMVDFGSGYSASTEAFTSGGGSITLHDNPIENIEIDWVSGSIVIYPAQVDTIDVFEAGNIQEGQEMVYAISGNTLKISYSKPAFRLGFFSTPKKDLTVVVPSDWLCDEISIDAASADVLIRDLNANMIDLNTASGTGDFDNCNVANLDIETASGNISYTGSVTTLDCDAASADITAIVSNTPDSINFDSASGDLHLTLPRDTNGFSVDLDALSGKFTSEFETTLENGVYTHKDGQCDIDVDCASGNVIIKKGQ